MDGLDLAVWIVAGFVAVSVLVRLMLARRDRLMTQFRNEMSAQKRRAARDKTEA
jgi:hypothetical protein